MSLGWSPSPWFLAEVNHVLASCVIVLICARQGWSMWPVIAAMAVVCALKEFWADLSWLEHDTMAGSVTDYVSYMLGALGTWLALYHLWSGVAIVSITILALTVYDILAQNFPNTFLE